MEEQDGHESSMFFHTDKLKYGYLEQIRPRFGSKGGAGAGGQNPDSLSFTPSADLSSPEAPVAPVEPPGRHVGFREDAGAAMGQGLVPGEFIPSAVFAQEPVQKKRIVAAPVAAPVRRDWVFDRISSTWVQGPVPAPVPVHPVPVPALGAHQVRATAGGLLDAVLGGVPGVIAQRRTAGDVMLASPAFMNIYDVARPSGGLTLPSSPTFMTLEPIVKKPFNLSEADLDYLSRPAMHDVRMYSSIFNRFKWDVVQTNKKFALGDYEVSLESYVSKGTYGAAFLGKLVHARTATDCVVKMIQFEDEEMVFKSTIMEMIIHWILDKTCRESEEIGRKQRAGKMARIPQIYAAFTLDGNMWKDVTSMTTQRTDAKFVVIVMEKLTQDAHSFMRSRIKDELPKYSVREDGLAVVNTALAFTLYQVYSLLEALQREVSFNHRDLHFGNIMVKVDRTRPDNCHNTFFQAYVIDFGMSRLLYRGRRFTTYAYYDVDSFSPHHDILFSLLTSRRPFSCDLNPTVSCQYFLPSINLFYLDVMQASGIDFRDPRNTPDKNTRDIYKAFQIAGEALRTKTCPTRVILDNINVHRITPSTVTSVLALILSELGIRCKGIGKGTFAHGAVNQSIMGVWERISNMMRSPS